MSPEPSHPGRPMGAGMRSSLPCPDFPTWRPRHHLCVCRDHLTSLSTHIYMHTRTHMCTHSTHRHTWYWCGREGPLDGGFPGQVLLLGGHSVPTPLLCLAEILARGSGTSVPHTGWQKSWGPLVSASVKHLFVPMLDTGGHRRGRPTLPEKPTRKGHRGPGPQILSLNRWSMTPRLNLGGSVTAQKT